MVISLEHFSGNVSGRTKKWRKRKICKHFGERKNKWRKTQSWSTSNRASIIVQLVFMAWPINFDTMVEL